MKMSQQKFASNVVEKCLTFGGPAERLVLVNEMLGSTDENEPLQVCNLNLHPQCLFPQCPREVKTFFIKQSAGDDERSIRELRSAKGS